MVDTNTPAHPQSNNNTLPTHQNRNLLSVGERVVCVLNRKPRIGVLHFIGSAHFSPGEWCGIALDEPCGKNDGSVKGVRYFNCKENYGIFVHSHKVRALEEVAPDLEEKEEKPVSDLSNILKAVNCRITKMDSVGIETIALDSVNLRKWPAYCGSRGALAKTRPRSFSSGMKYGLNLEPSSHGITDYLALDLADLSRSVSLPKIPSKQVFLISSNALDNTHTYEEQTGDQEEGCTRGSCPDLSQSLRMQVSPPKLNQESSLVTSPDVSQNTMTACSVKANSAEPDTDEHQHWNTNSNEPSESKRLSSGSEDCGLAKHKEIRNLHGRSHSVGDLRTTNPDSKTNPFDNVAHASLEKQSTIDAFVQGKYCSCPSLVPWQHVSGAIESCIDLGRRQELHIYESATKKTMATNGLSSKDPVSDSFTSEDISDSSAVNLVHLGLSTSMSTLTTHGSLSEDRYMGMSVDDSMLVSQVDRSVSWPCMRTQPRFNVSDNSLGKNKGAISEQMAKVKHYATDEQYVNEANALPSFSDIVQSFSDGEPQSTKRQSKTMHKMSATVKNQGTTKVRQTHSDSQASLSSTGTNDSQGYGRKGINGKSGPQTKAAKKGSNSTRLQVKGTSSAQNYKSLLSDKEAPPRIVKRHTVSALQQFKFNFSPTSRPATSRHPGSTVSEPDSTEQRKSLPDSTKQRKSSDVPHRLSASPNSRLPMIRRQPASSPPNTGSKSDKLPAKAADKATSRPPSGKRVTSITSAADKQKKDSSSASPARNSVARRKVSGTPVSSDCQKSVVQSKSASSAESPAKGRISTTSNRRKPALRTTRPGTTADSKAAAANSSKKATPVKTITEQPTSTTRQSSRLPRKISRDPSTESAWEHESVGSAAEYDADRSDLESSTRSWNSPQAPDILTGTREVRWRSVEVQVEIDDDKAVQDMHDKLERLDHLLAAKTRQCVELATRLVHADTTSFATAVLLMAFGEKLKNTYWHAAQLTRDVKSIEEELRQLRERLAEEEANGVKLQEEMMYVRSEHKVAIETLKADHERSLEALKYTIKKQQMEELTIAAQDHVAELKQLKQQHEGELTELRNEQEKAVANIHEHYKDEIVELESKHSSHVDELLEEHQEEVETIKADYDEERSALETKLFAVTSECTSLNIKLQRMQEETEKDIELRIQDAIDKYKRLPDELESMTAVLEMKNEEIKQLRTERMESCMELDHLRKVVSRIKKLEHENESLSFVVQNKSKLERQLSVEHESLKTNLEKESAKLKRLSLENEELQWRLFNSPSPGSEPPVSPQPNYRLSASFSDVEPITE